MPFYEYECSNCQYYFEALQKISDKPLKQCPSCKEQSLKKLVSAPDFRLEGSGWYDTAFESEHETKRNLADRAEAIEAKSEGSESKETKSSDTAKAKTTARKSVSSVKTPAKTAAKAAKSKPASKAKTTAKKAAKSAAKKKKTARR